ncbi:MAG: DNA polymerase III subunit gamma/tau [Pirellulales bacterium]|nr:DNA polymerase III subunit gamma/tau [Pirellulales bacterium]
MSDTPLAAEALPAKQYVVVARRYRPQAFAELVGQEHVSQALTNAIAAGRVGHAYLFTGARGVGKTSAARILAKALNCEKGTSAHPCNECDTCRAIAAGDDVDVLEIDGASNRGIDEIRQLRQNVNVRPSRSRHKIYIIDEVHMLTREAFNALLKTLEEPPEHVKFIFCTTEATKIPITILSRCQRFDFAGILTQSIAQRLRQIVDAEGVEADPQALEVLARRAAGSMRDSQSLLEQLLAFSSGKITVEDVHNMLGTAGDSLLMGLVGHIVGRDAAAALNDLDAALHAGVDAPQLVEQLFGYFRDCMAASVGCQADAFLYASPSSAADIAAAGQRLGLQTVLAMMQILDQTLSRMRYSTQGRILAELALVRICHLEDLEELAQIVAQVRSGMPITVVGSGATPLPTSDLPSAGTSAGYSSGIISPPALESPAGDLGGKKNDESIVTPYQSPPEATPKVASPTVLTPENAMELWNRAIGRVSGMVADHARRFHAVAISAPNTLAISFKAEYAMPKSMCERQVVRFEQALAEVTGQPIRLQFIVEESGGPSGAAPAPVRAVSQHQLVMEIAKHPMVQQAAELFGATPVKVDPPNRE